MSDKKYYQTQEFKKLQKEWENKLMESGFEDIEKTEKNENIITPQMFQNKNQLKNRQVVLLVQNLITKDLVLETENGKPKEHHKIILEQYAEGKTTREISAHLKTLDKQYHMGFQGVARVIARYLKKYNQLKEVSNGSV